MELTGLDYIFLGMTAFFVISSMSKGFFKEFTSLVVLVISVVISYYLGGYAKLWLDTSITIEFISVFLAFVLTFFAAFFFTQQVFKFSFNKIHLDARLDSFLGVIFGVIKSFVIIMFFIIVIDSLVDINEQPDFLKKSYIKNRFYEFKHNMFFDYGYDKIKNI